jgi:hypothetical protein
MRGDLSIIPSLEGTYLGDVYYEHAKQTLSNIGGSITSVLSVNDILQIICASSSGVKFGPYGIAAGALAGTLDPISHYLGFEEKDHNYITKAFITFSGLYSFTSYLHSPYMYSWIMPWIVDKSQDFGESTINNVAPQLGLASPINDGAQQLGLGSPGGRILLMEIDEGMGKLEQALESP